MHLLCIPARGACHGKGTLTEIQPPQPLLLDVVSTEFDNVVLFIYREASPEGTLVLCAGLTLRRDCSWLS